VTNVLQVTRVRDLTDSLIPKSLFIFFTAVHQD